MTEQRVVAVGASAGGLEALRGVVRTLPREFPAPILVVIHGSPDFPSELPQILTREGALPAEHARDGSPAKPGHIYVAPPNFHMSLGDGRLRVWYGPKVNAFRPAIDPLFRSVAEDCGAGAVGVLLSGGMTDGVAGLLAIKRAGGTAVVQDPDDAVVGALPLNALSAVQVDRVAPASAIGPFLVEQLKRPDSEGVDAMSDTMTKAEEAYRRDFDAQARGERKGEVSLFSCPHCGGVMRQTDETVLAEFLCHIGHAYEGEALLAAQQDTIETTAWNLVRALKERALLARELAALAGRRGDVAAEARLGGTAREAERHRHEIERDLLNGPQE